MNLFLKCYGLILNNFLQPPKEPITIIKYLIINDN